MNAFAASAFFSMDRYASYKQDWGDFYESGGLIVADRYTTSNAVHQASKLLRSERKEYLDWLFDLEYEKFGLPKPDLVIYLDMPTEITERMMRQREQATGTHADIHEQDEIYLKNCRANAREIAKECGWSVINCARDGAPRTPEDIHAQVYRMVKKLLSQRLSARALACPRKRDRRGGRRSRRPAVLDVSSIRRGHRRLCSRS